MKQIYIKIIIVLFSTLFLLCSNYSCKKKIETETIRIGVLEGPSAISFIQIIENKPVIQGKQIEVVIKNEPLQIQAMMLKNELDFAILPTVMAANLYNKGVKYRMAGCPIWGTLYLVSNNKNIKSLSDLTGKSISIFGQGTTADILIQHVMKENDVKCDAIDYRFKTNQELAQALLMSQTDAAILSEPLVSIISEQDTNIRIVEKINCQEYLDNSKRDIFVQTAFLVSNEFINNHSDLISQVCNAYVNSCNFINEKPEDAAKLLVAHRMMPNTAIALKSIDLCNIQYVSSFALYKELYSYLHIFYATNPESIGGRIPKNDFIYQVY